jgi:hypothetical protein
MPEIDANEDFARLPGVAAGGLAVAPHALLRHLDVVVVLIATPVAISLGAPALGVILAAGAWVVQRVLAHVDGRWIRNTREPGRQMGLNLFEAFGRIWLLAGAIVAAGLIGTRADGLAAALVVFAAYSIAFAMRLIDGRPQGASEL